MSSKFLGQGHSLTHQVSSDSITPKLAEGLNAEDSDVEPSRIPGVQAAARRGGKKGEKISNELHRGGFIRVVESKGFPY